MERSRLVGEPTALQRPGAVGVGVRRAEPDRQVVDPGLCIVGAAEDVDGEREAVGQKAEVVVACGVDDRAESLEDRLGRFEFGPFGEAVRGEEAAQVLHLRLAVRASETAEIARDLLAAFQRRRFPQAEELGVQHDGRQRRIVVPGREFVRFGDQRLASLGRRGEREVRGQRGEQLHPHRVVVVDEPERVLAELDQRRVRVVGNEEERAGPGAQRRRLGHQGRVAGRARQPRSTGDRLGVRAVADRSPRRPEPEPRLGPRHRVRVGVASEQVEHLLVAGARRFVGERHHVTARRPGEVDGRLRLHARQAPVAGELVELFCAAGFEGLGDASVRPGEAGGAQVVEQRVPHDRVREPEQIDADLGDEARAAHLVEQIEHVVSAAAGELGEEVELERRSDHRG